MEDTMASAMETALVELPGYLMNFDWLKDTTYTNNSTLCHMDAKLQYTLHSEISRSTNDGSRWQQISDGVLLWPEALPGKELDPSKVASRKEYLSILELEFCWIFFCWLRKKIDCSFVLVTLRKTNLDTQNDGPWKR